MDVDSIVLESSLQYDPLMDSNRHDGKCADCAIIIFFRLLLCRKRCDIGASPRKINDSAQGEGQSSTVAFIYWPLHQKAWHDRRSGFCTSPTQMRG
jgi:hypothetical protein